MFSLDKINIDNNLFSTAKFKDTSVTQANSNKLKERPDKASNSNNQIISRQ